MVCIRTNEGKLLMRGVRAHPSQTNQNFMKKPIRRNCHVYKKTVER